MSNSFFSWHQMAAAGFFTLSKNTQNIDDSVAAVAALDVR